MNKLNYILLLLLSSIVILAISCKKDYYQNGGLSAQSEEEKNMLLYDFIKSRKTTLFDSLIKVIDYTNTKNLINQDNITFIAPTNATFFRYQSQFSNANKLQRELLTMSKDTLTMLLKRFIIPNSHVLLSDVEKNPRIFLKDANNDSVVLIGNGGGVSPGTTIQTSAYYMSYEHRKKPNVDSINYVSSGMQTHNLITKNAVLHVLGEFGKNSFGAGIKTPFFLR